MRARATSAPRTLVIGDVHGCLDELVALVALAGLADDDRVVFVGDLVAKGPDSAGVIAWARERGAAAVLGNHDEHVLRARAGDSAAKRPHLEVANTLTNADVDWLTALPLWVRVDGAGKPYVVVHGGMVPGVPVEKQTREHLLTMRSITPDGRPSKRIEGAPWASLWKGPEYVVFGHDAVRGLQRHPLATGIDTGCVYGRELSGLLLPEHRLMAVPARHAYAEMK
jgi:diadenosine tetraphosphatase ApaH/serine/threonine PP2A family protein phosphatase